MAKQGGLAQKLIIGGYDFSGDIGVLSSVHGGPSYQDMTGIDKSAHERVGTERDGSLEFTSFWNTAVGQATDILRALPRTDVMNTYMTSQVLGAAAACMIGKQNNYDPKRGQDASLTVDTKMEANAYGLEWGRLLTAGMRTDTTATNGTGVDHTDVSTLFGWQAYLQVTAFTGTSVTVTLQDSADNVTFANLTSGAFTAATAAQTTQRLQSGATDTVRRYVRAITSGTFSSATFCVVFMRNYVATAF